MSSRANIPRILCAVLSAGLPIVSLQIQPVSAMGSADELWSRARLYQSDSGLLRSVDLSGRLQYDYTHVEYADASYEEGLWRRFRFGFKSRLADAWTVHLEADIEIDDDFHSDYSRLTDAWIGWDFGEDWQVRLLKQSAGFTLDGVTSSKRLLTPERNNLTNNLWYTAEYFTGMEVSGSCAARLGCSAGIFSPAEDEEFSNFDTGNFALLSLDSDLAQWAAADRWKVAGFYVHNDPNLEQILPDQPDGDEPVFTPPYNHIVSLVSQWERGDWGIWADIAGGMGGNTRGDTYGMVAMPFHNFADDWQLVTRYTWLRSEDAGGVEFGRYENRLPVGAGDRYREIYAGLNWFIHDHRLKAQLGVQHAIMDGLDTQNSRARTWGVTLALRSYW